MPIVFVRVMDGIGNQIFQYAFAQWLRRDLYVSPVLYDPGSNSLQGPLTRAVQLGKLFHDCRILKGAAAKAIHFLSLSRKYQASLGAIGLRHYSFYAPGSWPSVVSAVSESKRHCYPVLSGYFQFSELVRSQLNGKYPLSTG